MCLAIPGQIVDVFADGSQGAIVEVIGVRRRIDLSLLEDDPPRVGDWVLIHVGFAMSRISEAEAIDQLDMLRQLDEHDAAEEEVRGYGLGDEAVSEDK